MGDYGGTYEANSKATIGVEFQNRWWKSVGSEGTEKEGVKGRRE